MEPALKIPSYLVDTHRYELPTLIVSKEGDLYEFEDSIFHLQGGGQPNDKGYLKLGEKQYQILSGVSSRETGRLQYRIEGELNVGDHVVMYIDGATREQHAKIHSSGHLIDLAVQRLHYKWETSKGYHFTDGPYVEYIGPLEDKQKAIQDINKQLQNILSAPIQTKLEVYTREEAVALKLIPQEFKTSFVRVVDFAGSKCPCGGTHIHGTKEIEALIVTRIQKKGKNVKVYYSVK